MGKRLSTNEWIEKVNNLHPNKFTFNGTRFLGQAYSIRFQCREHGELQFMRAQAVFNKETSPCRYCNGYLPEFEHNQQWLQKWMKYNPETGTLVIRTNNQEKGYLGNNGYLYISFSGKEYLVHRLIMLYQQGSIPMEVDHIDSNTLNNKWKNLRNADRTLQELNKKSAGVYQTKEFKYLAKITYEGRVYRSKHVDSYDEAKIMYEKAREKLIKKHVKKLDNDIVSSI